MDAMMSTVTKYTPEIIIIGNTILNLTKNFISSMKASYLYLFTEIIKFNTYRQNNISSY